nr:unnamed protein product [Callosobruchus analis]
MDDFQTCLKENKIVCRVDFDIVPNTSNNAWKIIQKSRFGYFQYRKDRLRRFRCLSNSFLGKEDDIAKSLLTNENDLLRNYSLQANIEELHCRNYQGTQLTSFDYAVLFGTIGLVVTVVVATIMDVWLGASGIGSGETAVKYVQYLSIVSNWKIMTRPSTNIDRHKLKGMQGMRVLCTIYVIIGHTAFSVLICFVKNTKLVEEYGDLVRIGIVFGMYIVQISFLISGWLLANGVYNYIAKTGRFTVKDVILLIVYRYLRLFPVMIILQSWEWSNLLYIQDGLPFEFLEMQRNACRNYWWRSILLINNFSKGSDQCNAALWSLANDFQMYLISVCLFYIIFKYKKSLMLFVYTSGIFCGIHGYEITDLDAVQVFQADEFYVMYSSLYVNFASYAIGVIFGSFYYEYKNIKIENSVYPALWAAIIGPFAKPTISFCLSIGIMGMAFGLGACQKENRIVCKIYFNILPPNSTSNKAWNIIQQSKKSDINQYRKDKLKRFRCLPNRFLGKEEIAKSVVATENELLKKYSLHVDIQKMYCRRYSDINLTSFDFGVKYIKYFSWSSNWKALIRSTGKDGQKLKALQGMRVLSTMYIIHFHISIVVSSELLLKDPRLFPVMFIIQLWQRSNWFYVKGTLPYDLLENDRRACKKYWWRSLLLINNFSEGCDQCNPALWSLANDFQMYVISVCLFYIIFKYKKTLMLFVYMTAIFCSIHGYEMYKNGYRHILAFAGERDLDISGIFGKGKFFVMYGSIYVNFGSYAVGVIFGSFYHQYKNIKVENSLYSTLWAAIIGPFVKPSASLCLAIGIFGMTLGLGGIYVINFSLRTYNRGTQCLTFMKTIV